jgi:hypothetical protein
MFTLMDEQRDHLKACWPSYSRVHSFFTNQVVHFDRSVQLLLEYQRNKLYASDRDLESAANQITEIVTLPDPYPRMHELPLLIEKYERRFSELMKSNLDPVKEALRADWEEVRGHALEKLAAYRELKDLPASASAPGNGTAIEPFQTALDVFIRNPSIQSAAARSSIQAVVDICRSYKTLQDNLGRATNLSEISGIGVKAGQLRADSMSAIDHFSPEQATGDPEPPVVVRREARVRVSSLIRAGDKVESKDDIEKLVSEIKRRLLAAMDGNDGIRFE